MVARDQQAFIRIRPPQQAGQRSTADEDLDRELICAARDDEIAYARRLIRQGASTMGTDDTNETALHWAAGLGDVEMAKLLLKHGADPNMQSSMGATALHQAAMEGHLEILELFASKGFNACTQSTLTRALANQHTKVVAWLYQNCNVEVYNVFEVDTSIETETGLRTSLLKWLNQGAEERIRSLNYSLITPNHTTCPPAFQNHNVIGHSNLYLGSDAGLLFQSPYL